MVSHGTISIQKIAQGPSDCSDGPAAQNIGIYRSGATLASSNTAIYRTVAPGRSKPLPEPAGRPQKRSKSLLKPVWKPPKRSKLLLELGRRPQNRSILLLKPARRPQKRIKTAAQACFKPAVALKSGGRTSLLKVTVRRCSSLCHFPLFPFARLYLTPCMDMHGAQQSRALGEQWEVTQRRASSNSDFEQ